MDIKNDSKKEVSWFCFNHLDTLKTIALASGNLAKGDSKTYTPPDNIDGFYSVRFTEKGGINELAMGTVSLYGTISLIEGKEGIYTVEVKKE